MSLTDHHDHHSQAGAAQGAGTLSPAIRTVGLDRPWAWLSAGWRDFAAAPHVSLTYGIALVCVSFLLVAGLSMVGLFYLVLPLTLGFMLVAPVLAVGLYESSRRLAAGEPTTITAAMTAIRRNPTQIAYLGVALLALLIFWVRVAFLVFMMFFSYQPPTLDGFVDTVFFSASSIPFLITGTLIGAAFAAVAFAMTAVSIPMLLDRQTNVFHAIVTSFRAVMHNWKTMAGWAGLIVLFTAAGLATAFIGLALALPLIGHATWHAYKDLVAEE